MTDPRNRFVEEGTKVIPARVAVATVESGTGQLCAVAAALDALGDRWSILLLRDLLWHGPSSAVRLADRNPGLTVDDVVDRLERLEDSGLVESFSLDHHGDVGFTVSPLGRSADVVVRALYGFGLNIVRRRPITTQMLAQVITVAAIDHHDAVLDVSASAVVGLDVAGRRMGVVMAPGILRADPSVESDVEVACTQDVFVDVLEGLVGIEDAIRRGELEVDGPLEPVVELFELLRYGP